MQTIHQSGWKIHLRSYARLTIIEQQVRQFVQQQFTPDKPLDHLIGLAKAAFPPGKLEVMKQRCGQIDETAWYCMAVRHIKSGRWVVSVSEPHDIRRK